MSTHESTRAHDSTSRLLLQRIRDAEIERSREWDIGAQTATEEFWDAALLADRSMSSSGRVRVYHPDGDWTIEVRVPQQSLVPGLVVYTMSGESTTEERWLTQDDTIVLPYGTSI